MIKATEKKEGILLYSHELTRSLVISSWDQNVVIWLPTAISDRDRWSSVRYARGGVLRDPSGYVGAGDTEIKVRDPPEKPHDELWVVLYSGGVWPVCGDLVAPMASIVS